MSGNFWQSSHCKQWLLTQDFLTRERNEDLQLLGETDYQKIMMFFANVIQAIGEQLKARQQVIATATIYFKRFYSKHPLRSCDPLLLAPTCILLASKVEEFGVLSNNRISNATTSVIKSKFSYAFPNDFIYRHNHIWECEFYLLELMDCCLVVYHPYRPLVQYVADLNLADSLLPIAWRIVNDTYRTDVNLLYPPFQIALACLHMACVMQNLEHKAKDWFADLNVDIDKIIEITRVILKLYELWKDFNEKIEVPELLKKMPKAIIKSESSGRTSAPISGS
ncbi:cyclin-C-like [Clavelina lepadiformis]|uniref:cyclin-C-like n=1 Tax=Clavelina lepadiformis TaxID=159417 RepID=UPI004041F3A3